MKTLLNKTELAKYFQVDRRRSLPKYMEHKDFPEPEGESFSKVEWWDKEVIDAWVKKSGFPMGENRTRWDLAAWAAKL